MLRASSELESRAALIISTHLLRTHGCWYEHERIYLGDEEFSQETKVDSDSGFDVFFLFPRMLRIGTCTIDVNFRSSETQHSVRSINGGFAALFPQWRAIWKATGVHELERSDGASPGTVDWHPSFERDCMAQFPGYEDMPSEV